MEGVERDKVRLLPHNSEWEEEFIHVKNQIDIIWKSNLLDIQHVGSTAIYSVKAKPILDVAILLKSIKNMDIESMKQLGYDYCGPRNGCDTYHLFVLRGENQISLRHLHCYDATNKQFFQVVGFRDYLNLHSEEAVKYSETKEELSVLYPEDRIAYTKGKENFILGIYALLDL